MSHLSIATLLAGIGLATIGCNSENSAENRRRIAIEGTQESRAYLHSFSLPSHGVAIEGYCPVAYFEVNKPVKGKPEHASAFNGVTYYFVSAGAKETFDKEPEKYIPAFGGWCAFGMSIEDKFPVDPENFKIVDGRLFLYLKNNKVDARKLWNGGDEKQLVGKAEAHWKKVQG